MDEQTRNEAASLIPEAMLGPAEPFAAEKAAVKAEIAQEIQGAVESTKAFVDQVAEAAEDVSDVMLDAKGELVAQLRARKRDLARYVRSSKERANARVHANPWPLVVGGLVVGLFVGGIIGANADRD